MKLSVEHTTIYQYQNPVLYSIAQARLTPREEATQTVLRWDLQTPSKHKCAHDHFGNVLCTFSINKSHWQMVVKSSGIVEIQDQQTGWFAIRDTDCPTDVFLPASTLTEASSDMLNFAKDIARPNTNRFEDWMLLFAQAVADKIAYTKASTTVADSARVAFEKGKGVCQDQAHVMIACMRALQIPARYVSGYRYCEQSPEHASHAWLDVFDKVSQQWLSIDPTHVEIAGKRHCRLAVAKDYAGAAPLRGVRSAGGDEKMVVEVNLSEVT